jgi:hypothetical protein
MAGPSPSAGSSLSQVEHPFGVQLARAETANRDGLPLERSPGEVAIFDVTRKDVTGVSILQPCRTFRRAAQFRQIGQAQRDRLQQRVDLGCFRKLSIWSSVTAFSTSNAPTHVRLSVTTWPRQPSARPRSRAMDRT